MKKLTTEQQTFQNAIAAVPFLIAEHARNRAAPYTSEKALAADYTYNAIVAIGDQIVQSFRMDCATLVGLVSKHADHGYRPTLRGKPGSPEIALADCYDFFAAYNGLAARAFRG